jgi:large subunit ribosomal protein L25
MVKSAKLTVQKRTETGRKVKKLRKQGIIPANIFGSKIKSLSISVKLDDFKKIYKLAGESSLLEMTVEGETKPRPAIIADIQVSPLDKFILHIDFRQVDLTEKVESDIHLKQVGESPAVDAGGVLIQVKDTIEVETLPGDIPEAIEVDVSSLLEIGDAVLVENLKVSDKVKILDPEDTMLFRVDKQEEEEVEPEPEVEEGAEDAEGAEAKGETKEEDKDAEETNKEKEEGSKEKAE